MGKLPNVPDIINLTELKDVVRFLSQFMKGVQELIGGNLNFNDNFRGQIIDVSFTNGIELKIPHNLKFIPSGYLVTKTSTPMSVSVGTTQWTNSDIYLRSNATGTATVLII